MTSEIVWRRRWKPDLRSQPWKPMSFGGIDDKLLIKCNFSEMGYEILLSNKISLWHEELKVDDVKKRTMKLNPSVEAPVSKILDHIRDNFDDTKVKATANFKDLPESEEQKIIVTLSTKLAGLPFVWKFSAMPADTKMVSEHLIIPLLTMTGELNRRQQELYKLLRNKDKEIDDLKAQGVKVSRKHLETGAFDDVVFKHSMSVTKGFQEQVQKDGDLAFSPDGQELYRELMTKRSYLERDEDDDMDGEGTFDDDCVESAVGGTSGASWSNRLPPSLAGGSLSPKKSPTKSPAKSPNKGASGDDASPSKDTELLRRQALERRLAEESLRKEQKKKKKKIKF